MTKALAALQTKALLLSQGCLVMDDSVALVQEAVKQSIIDGQVKSLEAVIAGTVKSYEEFVAFFVLPSAIMLEKFAKKGAKIIADREARIANLENQLTVALEQITILRETVVSLGRRLEAVDGRSTTDIAG